MTNQNLEKLENAIRQALPELMEVIPFTDLEVKMVAEYYIDLEADYKHQVTIIHLLRWLDTLMSSNFSLGTNGLLQDHKEAVIYFLDLSKPLLSQQSDEVIDELVKLVPCTK